MAWRRCDCSEWRTGRPRRRFRCRSSGDEGCAGKGQRCWRPGGAHAKGRVGASNLMSQISVVIPTYKRHLQLCAAIKRILDCRPPPAEIIVHIDGGDSETEPCLRAAFP